jgi:nicotinamidase-related amidase
MMTELTLQARYFQDSTPEGVPCREENFQRREVEVQLPVAQTALVLVDMWDRHFIDSWIERAAKITTQFVVPAVAAARQAGIHIIHAPSPPVASQYEQAETTAAAPSTASVELDWPPQEFRNRQGDYAAFAGPRQQAPGIGSRWNLIKGDLGVSPEIAVAAEDTVVETGAQMHRVLARRGILHLIFAGFAANWCLMGRDYGIRAMSRYGYYILVLRDCTAGVEFPDTLENSLVTEMTIREIEQQYGFSVGNEAFLTGCKRGG